MKGIKFEEDTIILLNDKGNIIEVLTEETYNENYSEEFLKEYEDEEITWSPIEDLDGYSINNFGYVRNDLNGKILKHILSDLDFFDPSTGDFIPVDKPLICPF